MFAAEEASPAAATAKADGPVKASDDDADRDEEDEGKPTKSSSSSPAASAPKPKYPPHSEVLKDFAPVDGLIRTYRKDSRLIDGSGVSSASVLGVRIGQAGGMQRANLACWPKSSRATSIATTSF